MSDATVTRTKFKTAITELVVNRGLSVDMHSEGDLISKALAKGDIKEFLEASRDVEYFELTVSNGQWLSFANEADGMELSDYTERHLDIVNLFSNELVEPAPVVHFRITTDNNSTWGLYSDTIEGAIDESSELVKYGNVGAIIKDMAGNHLRQKMTGVDGWTVASN